MERCRASVRVQVSSSKQASLLVSYRRAPNRSFQLLSFSQVWPCWLYRSFAFPPTYTTAIQIDEWAQYKRTFLHIYQFIHKSRNLFVYLSIHPSIHPIHVSTCMPSRPFSSLSPSPYLSSPSRSRISICEDARRGWDCHDDWHITRQPLTVKTVRLNPLSEKPILNVEFF